MRNVEMWTPSKFVMRGGCLTASGDPRKVGIGSRLNATVIAEHFAEALPGLARGRLLDLGCGEVPLFEAYRDCVDSVVCVDWGASPHSKCHLDCQADISRGLPFSGSIFDTVILSDVLEHVGRPEALLAEIRRVLDHGGRVLASVPFMYWIHERPHDYFRYTEYSLRAMVDDAGMQTLMLKPMGGGLHVLADVASKTALRISPRLKPLAAAVQRAALLLRTTAIGRRALRTTADDMPLGYFLVAEKPRRRS